MDKIDVDALEVTQEDRVAAEAIGNHMASWHEFNRRDDYEQGCIEAARFRQQTVAAYRATQQAGEIRPATYSEMTTQIPVGGIEPVKMPKYEYQKPHVGLGGSVSASPTPDAKDAEIERLKGALAMFVNASGPRRSDGHHEMPLFPAREIEAARAILSERTDG